MKLEKEAYLHHHTNTSTRLHSFSQNINRKKTTIKMVHNVKDLNEFKTIMKDEMKLIVVLYSAEW